MATETMAIIEAGGYRSPGGHDVRGAPTYAAFTRVFCLPAEL